MGYYIRVLGKNTTAVPLQQILEASAPAVIEDVIGGGPNEWQQITLKHKSGEEIAVIERNLVVEGELRADEVQELLEEAEASKPRSAADWLKAYLPSVTVIYAFQLLGGTDIQDGWSRLHKVYRLIWENAGGILQADGEGMSNEDGYTILWQFSDNAEGPWNFGLLDATGKWIHFEMELGSSENRESFLRGELPTGARIL